MTELYSKDDPWLQSPPEPYRLPYANAAVQVFIDMANGALQQVRTAEQTCRSIMEANESTTVDVLPTFPQLQKPLSSGLLSSNKALLLEAESCVQAQSVVCQALASALDTAQQQRSSLERQVAEVDGELKELTAQAARLRANMTQITDDPRIRDTHATAEAKRLLSTLETAYQKHAQRKALQQSIDGLNADAEYLHSAQSTAQAYSRQTEQLLKRVDNEWQQLTSMFGINGEEATGDLLRSQALTASLSRVAAEAVEPETAEAEVEAEARPSAWGTIWSYTRLIILAFLAAILLRAYCFDVTVVDGDSMRPTLADGDVLISAKLSLLWKDPQPGDIVVLNAPDAPGDNYIKRVIAGPDDELIIADGRVFLNGQRLTEPYLPDGLLTEGDVQTVIPDGFYFVMGDNREDSRDSRVEAVGLISRDAIKGRATLRLYPFNNFGSLD